MDNKIWMLNDFEIKSLITDLSDLNVVNAFSFFDEYHDSVFYIFFFKLNGHFFCERSLYCDDPNIHNKPDFGKFLNRARADIANCISGLNTCFFENVELDEKMTENIENLIYFTLITQNILYMNAGVLLSKNADYSIIESLGDDCVDLKDNLARREEVMINYLDRFGMIEDIVLNAIVGKNK